MPEPAFSVFNDGYAAEVYEAYRRDPAAVGDSWRQFFLFAEQLSGGAIAPQAHQPELAEPIEAASSL